MVGGVVIILLVTPVSHIRVLRSSSQCTPDGPLLIKSISGEASCVPTSTFETWFESLALDSSRHGLAVCTHKE